MKNLLTALLMIASTSAHAATANYHPIAVASLDGIVLAGSR